MAKSSTKQSENVETPATSATFTQVRVSLFEKDSLKGLATCKVADAVYVTGLRIIEGKSGLFVSMPSRKTSAGEYQDIAFPASKAMRDELQAVVLAAYHAEVKAAQ
jgi:stage V sporulation protein G